MSTIKLPGFILKSEYGTYMHASFEGEKHGYITVCKHDIEVTLPADFNPIAAEVSMLNKKLDDMADKHAYEVKQVKDRIANLLCLENKPGDSA